jgi:hypothetical protein
VPVAAIMLAVLRLVTASYGREEPVGGPPGLQGDQPAPVVEPQRYDEPASAG